MTPTTTTGLTSEAPTPTSTDPHTFVEADRTSVSTAPMDHSNQTEAGPLPLPVHLATHPAVVRTARAGLLDPLLAEYAQHKHDADTLASCLTQQRQIGQAIGKIMATYHLSDTRAEGVLNQLAHEHSLTPHDMAHEIIAVTTGQPADRSKADWLPIRTHTSNRPST